WIWPLLLLFSYEFVQGAMLFIDTNNANEEVEACRRGVKALNPKEDIRVVRPPISCEALEKKVREMEAAGQPVDSVVISGEYVKEGIYGAAGRFSSSCLKQIADRHSGIKSLALWGCYTSTAAAAKDYWLHPMKNIKFIVGFTDQAPSKIRPASQDMLEYFCYHRQQAAQITDCDQMINLLANLKSFGETSIGACTHEFVASRSYGEQICYRYDEVCKNFDAEKVLEQYDGLMDGKAGFEDVGSDDPKKPTLARKTYTEMRRYEHCGSDYDLPDPVQVMNLVKFKYITENFSRLNAQQLREYDENLEQLGLGQYRLGNLKELTRGEMIRRINASVEALTRMAAGGPVPVPQAPPPRAQEPPPARTEKKPTSGKGGGLLFGIPKRSPPPEEPKPQAAPEPPPERRAAPAGSVDPKVVLEMAEHVARTFWDLDPSCIPASSIAENSKKPSGCLITYKQAANNLR
ncbi:MAG: hypothetical protein AB7P49_21020, partial [Bdellovibrionales bacterium]